MKMSRGLASFVEGRSELAEDDADVDSAHPDITEKHERTDGDDNSLKRASSIKSMPSSHAKTHTQAEYNRALVDAEATIMSANQKPESNIPAEHGAVDQTADPSTIASLGETSISITSPEGVDKIAASPDSILSEASTMKQLFSRAANLIREAFEIDGGTVFYDAQKGFNSEYGRETTAQTPLSEMEGEGDDELQEKGTGSRRKLGPHGMFMRTSIGSEKRVETLGFSTSDASSIHQDATPGSNAFTPFDEKSLHTLLRRYPRGKLWTFGEDGYVSLSEDDGQPLETVKSSASTAGTAQSSKARLRAATEAKFLLRHFNGARQILFVPLWDAGRSRWLSGCFTWSNEPTRVLSKQTELAFMTAFGNCVMAECSRIDTEIADQKKGDFIGSISHELRSPLHGILASAEFLSEEVTDGFSKGLVDTIDSCGRTLLDTIVSLWLLAVLFMCSGGSI